MADHNRLIKDKTYIPGVAGQPYIAPQPARTVTETRTVCGYYPNGGSGGGSGGHYMLVPADPTVGRYQDEYVWINDNPGGSSGSSYACKDQQVTVSYPATPGQPYIAAVPAGWDYHLGWNSGARSTTFIQGSGKATFQARSTVVGAVVGLNGYQSPLSLDGLNIAYGWYFTKGTARVSENGVFKTGTWPYTDATVFTVRRTATTVQYLIDGTLAYTSAATSTEILWMQAALYAGDDEVFNPTLTNGPDPALTVTGTLTLTLPPPRMALGDARGQLKLRLPPAPVAILAPPWGPGSYRMGPGGGALTLRLPSAAAALREGLGAVLRLRLPATALSAGLHGLAAPSFSALNLTLPTPMQGFGGLVGAVGQLTLKLAPPRMAAASRAIGRLRLSLPVMNAYLRAWPYNELPDTNGRVLLTGAATVTGVATLPTQPMVGVLSGAASPYGVVTLGTATLSGLLVGSMDAQAVVTLPVQPFVGVLSGRIDILSGLNELWVMNTEGGGTTQYEHYPFNSFAKIGNRYYGAGDDGLYLLEGPDDAGQPIAASFGLGQLDFGSPQLKTVTHCYLGTAAGALQLKIDALLNGAPASYTYAARGHGASMREVRFDLGRGLRSTYVQPTFYNVDGSAFEVDAVKFLVAESARRI